MQHPMLPALALATLAAAASAQTMPVKRSAPSELFSFGVTYTSANEAIETLDAEGYTFDLRASVLSNVFLTASYTDLQVDFTPSPDVSSYTVGLGTKFAAGNGSIEVSYAYRSFDLNGPEIDQHLIKVGYGLELGNGFNVSLAVLEVINTEDILKNMTAPILTVGYRFGGGFSAEISHSTKGTLTALDFAGAETGSTTSIGVRYGY